MRANPSTRLAALRSRLLGRFATIGHEAGVAYGEAFELIQPLQPAPRLM